MPYTKRDLMDIRNFNFLAQSFAQMKSQGRMIDISAIISILPEDKGALFAEQYAYYLRHFESES